MRLVPASVAALSMLSGCMLMAAMAWSGAQAGATPLNCTDAPCFVEFAMTGSVQSWTVPAGVDQVTAAVAGGSGGGSGNTAIGGLGGAVTATLSVTAGDVLAITVGAAGVDGSFGMSAPPEAAFGGGGLGSFQGMGPMSMGEGSGGGGSFVFDTTADNELLIAAGGGGGTSGNATGGGNGGAGGPGSDGSQYCGLTPSGTGGTLAAGGAGGGNISIGGSGRGPATAPGTLGHGGDAVDSANAGGGGGGYYGGGAGGASNGSDCGVDGSGGGGSGFLATSATDVQTATNTGDGWVRLAYQVSVLPGSTSAASGPSTSPTASTSHSGSGSAPGASSGSRGPSGPSGVVELSSRTIKQGGRDTATGHGFIPGESVTATLHSAPITLGTFTASPSGVVRVSFIVPADFEPGEHAVLLTGASSGRTVSASLTVKASTTSEALASTGIATRSLLGVGLALFAGGVGVLALCRTRTAVARYRC